MTEKRIENLASAGQPPEMDSIVNTFHTLANRFLVDSKASQYPLVASTYKSIYCIYIRFLNIDRIYFYPPSFYALISSPEPGLNVFV